MALKKLKETVKTPTGSEYPVFWDDKTGDVYVGGTNAGGGNHAGKAKSAQEAWQKGNFYATTFQKMK